MPVNRARIVALGLAAALATPARAELVLSDLIVDLEPGKHARGDIEIWNNSPERTYVAVEPREVLNPALANPGARRDPDPEKLGLLVSPARMVLEPGQRKLIRIASLSSRNDNEHVFRVTVKPVVGELQSEDSGIKILVGYDVLVLVRPAQPLANVTAVRAGGMLTFSNAGNVSVEVMDGRQCGGAQAKCAQLPGKRLYPGASWSVAVQPGLPVNYVLRSPGRSDRRTY
jgi:P pilus assembly chaperone PapD